MEAETVSKGVIQIFASFENMAVLHLYMFLQCNAESTAIARVRHTSLAVFEFSQHLKEQKSPTLASLLDVCRTCGKQGNHRLHCT